MASRVVLTTAAVGIGVAAFYITSLHHSLATKLEHAGGQGLAPITTRSKTIVETLPEGLEDPSRFYVISDFVSKSVPAAALPAYDEPHRLLTQYLRRNMSLFSRFPQAKLLKFVFNSPEQKKTFNVPYIQNLDFVVGDIFCGGYQVKARSSSKVEFGLLSTPNMPIDGRLIIVIEDHGYHKRFVTQTIQWKAATENFVLPLDRSLARWLHEMASWWLLESGTEYLCGLKGQV